MRFLAKKKQTIQFVLEIILRKIRYNLQRIQSQYYARVIL